MMLSSQAQKRLFILGSFIVLLLAVLLFSRINALVESYSDIDHTNKVELNLEYIFAHLKAAESDQRGFLLTSDSSFLRSHFSARMEVDSAVAAVRTLTKDNLKQQQNISALRHLIDQRYQLFNNTLSKQDPAPAALILDIQRGKASTDRVQAHIDSMEVVEHALMRARQGRKALYERLTPQSLLFLVFAMLCILGFSYYSLSKRLRQSRSYAADLDRLNNELLQKNKQLENSVEELNSFNYIASHDLKEPLRKILFFTDTLTSGHMYARLPDDVKYNLERIHTSGTRMKTLLDDLLVYARASMTERKRETVDLNRLLDAVTESFSETIRKKGAQVTYKNLPVIQAVPSQLEQLFENLMSNALKYSKAGEPPVITIQSTVLPKQAVSPIFEAAHEHYHRILFSDNGIGFGQDNAEKIFELFQRLHQRHEFSGTGVGLTICRKIVQNHDGFITAQSETGNGTTFTIFLPANPITS